VTMRQVIAGRKKGSRRKEKRGSNLYLARDLTCPWTRCAKYKISTSNILLVDVFESKAQHIWYPIANCTLLPAL
jgi:hypothetical protein